MNPILQIFIPGIACFIIISLLIFTLFFMFNKCRLKFNTQSPLPITRASSLRADTSSTSFNPRLKEATLSELSEATNGFDSKLIIGDGSFGLVYRAKLPSGVTVAVKKLSPDAFQGLREFRAEMETLGKLGHPNIVKILGYCVSGSDRILIYEYMERGSLDQWLQDMSSSSSFSDWAPLSWALRIKIIKGVANGLAYLHEFDNHIVHRDIKASNVLLDNEFEAHIADFGLARRIEGANSHISTQAAGTMGYMPPEYLEGYTTASVKGDVYSFGVLMFEVATGKRPNWPVREEGREIWMMEWAKKRIVEKEYMKVIDVRVPRDGLNVDELNEYFRIANLCTSHRPKERPHMCDVVKMLDNVGDNSQTM